MAFTSRRRREEFSRRSMDHLSIGIGSGALGAILAGLGEAVFVKITHPGTTDPVLYPYAIFFYGLLGALMGGGLGILALAYYNLTAGKFTHHRSAATYLGLTFVSLAFFLVRFRIFRDVFDEKVRAFGAKGLLVSAVLLIAAALILLLWRLLLGVLLRHDPFRDFASPRGSFGTGLVLLALSGLAFGYLAYHRKAELTVSSAPAAPPPEGTCHVAALKPSVILIVVDTLRSDALGVYGRQPSLTPHIDSLARDGVVFQNAIGQASWTRPSIASILTSRLPSSHTAVHKDSRLPDEVETVAETLQTRCYATTAIVDNFNISAKNGFAQGFDRFTYLQPDYLFGATDLSSELAIYNILRKIGEKYLDSAMEVRHYYQDAEVVTDTAIGRLKDLAGRTSFLFLHYMDPHDPYFVHPYTGEAYARVKLGAHPDPKLAARMKEVYEGEVAFFDSHLGRVLEALKQSGQYDKTWIFLTADHGEEFFEHGGWWHGDTLYEEQIHLPLIVKPPVGADPWENVPLAPLPSPSATTPSVSAAPEAPATTAGVALPASTASPTPSEPATAGAPSPAGGYRQISALARLIDIAPTIVTAAGVKDLPAGMQGRPITLSDPLPAAVAEEDFEGNVLHAIRTPEWKLITANPGNPRGLPENSLFSLPSDPAEKTNVYTPEHAQVKPLASEMEAELKGARRSAATAESTGKLTGAEQENLKALGYAGGK